MSRVDWAAMVRAMVTALIASALVLLVAASSAVAPAMGNGGAVFTAVST